MTDTPSLQESGLGSLVAGRVHVYKMCRLIMYCELRSMKQGKRRQVDSPKALDMHDICSTSHTRNCHALDIRQS